MEDNSLQQPELVGRQGELDSLKSGLERAIGGKGSTIFLCGEAGIGKTRLVSEILSLAEKDGTAILRGWCLPECLEPLMPIKEALRGANMIGLMEESPPPKVLSAYVLNDAGMLYARAERTKTEMDADIFAAMLRAVSSFVTDSLRMMGKGGGAEGLSAIGHSGYKILIQSRSKISLAVVIEGNEDEFLIDGMNRTLSDIEPRLNPQIFDSAECGWLEEKISIFVNSAKYGGDFVQDDPKLRLENLFDKVLLGIQRASQQSPVIFFLDDVQWADPTTLGLFHYLARNTGNDRVMMLATYRPEDVMKEKDGKSHHLETVMQNMSRESLFAEIKLSRLGESDTDRFVANALGKCDYQSNFTQRIHRESEGNPFFILEVLRLMAAEGIIVKKEGVWSLNAPVDDIPIPSKVYDVIRRRLNRLRKDELDMLECASVVGEKFGSEVVGLSLGLNRISTLKGLSNIEKEHRLIHSLGAEYRFDHSKIREVMYSGINAELRAEYHRIVAQSYRQIFVGREPEIAEELAHHYLMARDQSAAEFLKMAADKAMKRYANEDAIRLFLLALDWTKDAGQRVSMLEKLGDLYTIVGQCEKAIEQYTEALGLATGPEIVSELYRKMAMTHERHSHYELGIAAAEKGLDVLGPEPTPTRARLLAALTWNHIKMGNYDVAMEHQLVSLQSANLLSDKREIATSHHQMGIICWFRGLYDDALGHYMKALALQRETGDERSKLNTLNNIGVIYMETGRLDDALGYFEEGLAYEEMVGDKDGMAGTIDNLGNLYHTKGELDTALGHHIRGLELYRMAGNKNGIAWSLSSLGYTYPDLGDTRRGIACQLESVEICREIGDQHILIYNYYGLADSYSKIGEFELALKYVDMALSNARELGARREEGASLYVLGCIQCKMGEFAKSRSSFQAARDILSGVGETSMLTMIDLDYGLLLVKEGKNLEARSILQKAHESFERMGMGLWLRKVEEALARLDAAP
jgi:tetratricopeptide (TPR) repeat protein